MKKLTQLVSAIVFAIAASAAGAQTIAQGTFTYVDTDIDALGVRPNGQFYAYLREPLHVSCMTGTTGSGRRLAFTFSNSTDYKAIKEVLQLSFALKKRVRVYANSCYMAHASDTNYQYPVIYFIDTL